MKQIWRDLVPRAVAKCGTPCYLFSWQCVLEALSELDTLRRTVPLRHWLSLKTSPVRPLLRAWRRLGAGVEVVSSFELLAALREGFSPDNILVNGVGKQRWLPDTSVGELRVHFDSVRECEALAELSRNQRWAVGLRVHCAEEHDPDDPRYAGQFGLLPEELTEAQHILESAGVAIRSLHFHLHSNIESAQIYGAAIEELAVVCKTQGLTPFAIDCGGGLPVPGERVRATEQPTWTIDLDELGEILAAVPTLFPLAREVWLENGRFVTGRAGVLVMRVIDIRERLGARYLVCDGGRTNHAFVSDWQHHGIFTIPARRAPVCHTVVCGPTCMAYDWLVREDLPSDITVNDLIVWMNAGAYHIPWETTVLTRFGPRRLDRWRRNARRAPPRNLRGMVEHVDNGRPRLRRIPPKWWLRLLRGWPLGVAFTIPALGVVFGVRATIASYDVDIPIWISVAAPIICLAVGLVIAFVRGHLSMLPDSFVDEIGTDTPYECVSATHESLRAACELTRPYYGREFVGAELAEQWRLANPHAFECSL